MKVKIPMGEVVNEIMKRHQGLIVTDVYIDDDEDVFVIEVKEQK
ncbi:hypothetical protein ACU1JV_21935 [Paenibacillus sp. T2-29]